MNKLILLALCIFACTAEVPLANGFRVEPLPGNCAPEQTFVAPWQSEECEELSDVWVCTYNNKVEVFTENHVLLITSFCVDRFNIVGYE